MSRLDGLTENNFVATLIRLRRDFLELKQRQRVSGQSGVLGYLTQTGNTWDYSGTIDTGSIVIGVQPTFTLLFTGDGTQPYPIANSFLDIFIDGTTSTHRLSSTAPVYTGTSGTAVLDQFLVTDKTTVGAPPLSDEDNLQWLTAISVFGRVDIYIKAYAVGSSPGTLTLTRTA